MKKKSREKSELSRVWTVVIVRVLFALVGLLIAGWLLYQVRTLLLLLVLSVFFCYLIAPVVHLFQQPLYLGRREIKLPRSVAIALVYLIIGVSLFVLVRWLGGQLYEQVTDLTRSMPGYIKSGSDAVNNVVNGANSWMRHLKLPQQWRDYVADRTKDSVSALGLRLETFIPVLLGYLGYLPWLILVPVLSFFMLRDAESFEQAVVKLVSSERLRRRIHWLLRDVSRTMAAYTRAQVIACAEIGVLVTIGLGIIGAPYAGVVGTVAGLLEFIPLIGPLIAACIAISLAMTVSFKSALIVALFLVVLRIAQDYVIYPRIVGRGIHMHPLIVIVAILAGYEVAGLIGIFLAIPVVGMTIVIYNHYLAHRGLENLRAVGVPSQSEPDLSTTGASISHD
ncbi:MAG TPA: AI-2E family transporter [Blastocatellia bacterium]|nr:AI-2E family transporter [Blastocatellia bacterium]